jgi:hypothetical protein
MILSSLHLVIFRYTYLTHMKSDFRIFSAMNSTLHFLYIYHLDFLLKKKILPSIFEKILWSIKFLKVPSCWNCFFIKIKMTFTSYETMGFKSWLHKPSRSYTLAYCRPIHLISIEFQNIDNDLGSSPKKLFLLLQLL